ncbi:MAG: hypothetical protein C4526_00390 [Nitrospiraceae bacterium]|nr:MAG: hypothetical protein C4526_00390 [Nitrospiraceae bacterium]
MEYYNKREKTANWLFKVAEYIAIALGVNALLPGSPLSMKNVIIGTLLLIILFVLALWVTPEKEGTR